MFFFTEDLVSAIKRSGFIPTGQTTFGDPDDFIALANEELQTRLVPHIIKIRQEFFTKHTTVPLLNQINHYPVPERAIGNSLRDVFFLPNASDSVNKILVKKIDEHDQQIYQGNTGNVISFYMEGDEVIVIPTPVNPSGVLMFYYFRKPSKIVSTSSCAKITGISSAPGLTTLTVDTDLTASLPAGSLVDFVQVKSPFLSRYIDVAIQSITATTIVVNTTDISNEAGTLDTKLNDYICPAQQTNIPQIPDVFHPILSEMVVARCMKSLGNMPALQELKMELVEKLRDAWSLIENRIEGQVDVAYDQNSLLNMVSSWSLYQPILR